MLVYVARHAEAEHNLKDLFHDTTVADVSLTHLGVRQASELARELKGSKLEAIFVSELRRTRQTADIVNIEHNVPIVVDTLLNDIVSGIAGRPVNEFRKLMASSSNPWNAKFAGGESYNEAKGRAEAFLRNLKMKDYSCVLVVTSGGIANNLYGLLNGLTTEEMYNRSIENAALLSFEL